MEDPFGKINIDLSKNLVFFHYMMMASGHTWQFGHEFITIRSYFLHTFYMRPWYHIDTEGRAVGKADAVEISADDPTADS